MDTPRELSTFFLGRKPNNDLTTYRTGKYIQQNGSIILHLFVIGKFLYESILRVVIIPFSTFCFASPTEAKEPLASVLNSQPPPNLLWANLRFLTIVIAVLCLGGQSEYCPSASFNSSFLNFSRSAQRISDLWIFCCLPNNYCNVNYQLIYQAVF